MARLHENLNPRDGGEKVCSQCGAPHDLGSYQDGAGKTVLLHEECVRFYQGHFWRKPDEELTIPDFLRRELPTDTGEAV